MTLTGLAQTDAPTAALVASASTDATATVVTLRGEPDVLTLSALVDVLARVIGDFDGPVIVDLAHTELIDAGTVRALARAWRFLDDRGRTLTLRSPSASAVQVLGLVDLAHLIERADARRSTAGEPHASSNGDAA